MRSLWKGPFIKDFILKQSYDLRRLKENSYKSIRIYSRNCIIFPAFVGLRFEIYNGKSFLSLEIKENMVGLKFGELIFTRKLAKHKKKTSL